jgi:hypothetical protein
VRCTSATNCRNVAERTVKNAYRKWHKAGNPGDFLAFLADQYAPIGAENDPKNLNSNWLRNVQFHLGVA